MLIHKVISVSIFILLHKIWVSNKNKLSGTGSSLGNFEISQVSNGADVRVIGPGSSINISGNRGNQRKSSSEINTVHIDGQNGGGFGGPLRINQRSENDVVRIGPNRAAIPNYNAYPQNNAYANRRPENYPRNPQFAGENIIFCFFLAFVKVFVNFMALAPASLRPSFQYPGKNYW